MDSKTKKIFNKKPDLSVKKKVLEESLVQLDQNKLNHKPNWLQALLSQKGPLTLLGTTVVAFFIILGSLKKDSSITSQEIQIAMVDPEMLNSVALLDDLELLEELEILEEWREI